MDSLQSIPLPPTSTIPLPQENEPKLVITSTTSGERSVSTVSTVRDETEENVGRKTSHKEKKKHKKEKHKHKHKHKDKDKSKEKKKDHPLITPEVLSQHASAIKAAMLKEVQNDSNDTELSQSIVDDLFKDFLASKMNEIESAYKKAAEKKDASGDVVNSVEEMNRLLDDELDTISANTPPQMKKSVKKSSTRDKSEKAADSSSHDSKTVKSLVKVSPDTKSLKSSATTKPQDSLSSDVIPKNSLSSVVKQITATDDSNTKGENKKNGDSDVTVKSGIKSHIFDVHCEKTKTEVSNETSEKRGDSDKKVVPLESKKPGKLQLAFKISQTSAELISSGTKVDDIPIPSIPKKSLEEGEVISSGHGSSSDSDSADNADVEDDDDGDISETGSLSDSDKETKDKSKKKKKKKKHKKKKKKHKLSKERDTEESEKRSKRKHSTHRSRSRSKSQSKKTRRSRTPSEKRKWSRSRSFSPDHGVWRSSKHKHDRDRSREREKDLKHDDNKDREYDRHHRHRDRDYDTHKYDRDYDRHRDRDRKRSRDRSREREYQKRDSEKRYGKWRSRSRSREKSKDKSRSSEDLRLKIDKAKLREIAMKNALAMARSGQTSIAGIDFAAIKAGGKSIDELTEFCARIAAKEKLKNRPPGLTSSSSSDEDGKKSDDEDNLIHHPFKVSEKSITMNIRNATPLPVLSPQEKITQQAKLRLEFPVSSGNVHRTKEQEWVPVEKSETVKTSVVPGTATAVVFPTSSTTIEATTTTTTALPAVTTEVKLMPVKDEDKVFIEPVVPEAPVDISSIISERIKAARKLAENPHDSDAMSAMQKAQLKASQWAVSKNLPGKFIGSTGAQILSQQELMGPDKKRQAWAKKVRTEDVHWVWPI